jgi:hypothetical protein
MLIRQATAVFLELRQRIGITYWSGLLAAAQEREGEIADARESVEGALQANPDEVVYRPENLRLRGELRLKTGTPNWPRPTFVMRSTRAKEQREGVGTARGYECRAPARQTEQARRGAYDAR